MKNNHAYLSLLCLFTMLVAGKCHKDAEAQLPPETTTGAMTFGCKINGQVFVPKDGNGKPGLFVEYTNLGTGPGGGWYLNIPAFDYKSTPNKGVSIVTDSLLLDENRIYEFKTTKGNAKAFYRENASWGVNIFPKVDNESGSMFIKKFDRTNRILSGTFFFTGINANGEKVNVTEGRFDVRY